MIQLLSFNWMLLDGGSNDQKSIYMSDVFV